MRTNLSSKNSAIFAQLRRDLIQENFHRFGVQSEQVLQAMDQIPREDFIPEEEKYLAYVDRSLPIGFGQTLSQPSLVALMAQCLETKPTDRILEIGTGCGYNAAVLSQLVKEVYSIEVIRPLYLETRTRLRQMDLTNVHLKCGDGNLGWSEKAPFDAIVLTTAPIVVPLELFSQLKSGGYLLAPLGTRQEQLLVRYYKDAEGLLTRETMMPVHLTSLGQGSRSRQIF